jgi:nitrate/nitrite transport system permease protein
MVSAVFHSADAVNPAPSPAGGGLGRGQPLQATSVAANDASAPTPALPQRGREKIPFDWRGLWLRVVPPILGLGLLVLVWELVSATSTTNFPSPLETFRQAGACSATRSTARVPTTRASAGTSYSSLKRVAVGFGMAALVGIPLGFMIGRFTFLSRMFNPLISLLRPVSPLAWLPIGLLVFKGANPAAIWTIFICSIWPMVINTAVGVQRVPQDYLNVARVLNLSEWKIVTSILFPAVLPYMLTGVRLAVGTAWLVIVAAEMLTGGVGIGFWVWDEWNNLNVAHIIIAIFVIGIVGLLLEFALIKRRGIHYRR